MFLVQRKAAYSLAMKDITWRDKVPKGGHPAKIYATKLLEMQPDPALSQHTNTYGITSKNVVGYPYFVIGAVICYRGCNFVRIGVVVFTWGCDF